MKIVHQSPAVKAAFQNQVSQKKEANRQATRESLGGGFLGEIGTAFLEFKQITNQFKGTVGEWGISLLLTSLPNDWILFNNALIPTNLAGKFTEIDHLIIGSHGIFLIEVKTWKGSFSAYKDHWKRREGANWVPIPNSPTSQSAYHQKMFQQWINTQIPNLPTQCISAPVVFPVAQWIGTTDCSVPVFQGAKALLEMIWQTPACLEATQVSAIAQLIQALELPASSTAKPKPILKKAQSS